ncbi:MAG: serine/threonine protein kinase, partial [Myxococcales bacterium]|nr:serine/threonine protein kinase [Myxococcales bacterium]
QTCDYADDARELFTVVVRVAPDHRDARARLASLDAEKHDITSLLRSDDAFWRQDAKMPDLTGFGELPRAQPLSVPPPTSTGPRSVPAPPPAGADKTQPGRPPSFARKSPAAGDIIVGRYQLGDVLGRGGMSTVYRAHDRELGIDVALKLCHGGQEDEANLLQRFKQELMISRELNHATIIRLYDIGDHEGQKFISMELLDGHCLRDVAGRLGLPRAVYCLHQLAVALGIVHDAGIVHRDVKPANVFLTKRDEIKLMDFGIAKRRRADDASGLTSTGFVAGSVGYMPPEQYAHFASVTATADIYALGVVGFEIISGTKLFDGDSSVAVLHEQLNGATKDLGKLVPDTPAELARLLSRMIAREPRDRPESCDEIAATLLEIAKRL